MIPAALLDTARAKGTDEEFQAYARQWPSVLTKSFQEYVNGEGRSVYAHIRSVSSGAGMAHKPEFSGVPLTQTEHSNQHQYGYEHYNPMDWWVNKSIEMLCNWINDVPVPIEKENKTRETIRIEHPNHMNAIKGLLEEHFKNPKANPIHLTIESDTRRRTTRQNRGLWGVIYSSLSDFYAKNPSAWGMDQVRSVINYRPNETEVHAMLKRLFNNNESTATLEVSRCSEYYESISNHMMDKYNYELKMPVNKYDYYRGL